jgi:hypothetical protein
MKRKLLVAFLIVSASLGAYLRAWPQSSANDRGVAVSVPPSTSWNSPPPLKLATVAGERLDYLVSWSDYLVAARVQLEAKESTASAERGGLQLQMQAQTVGVVRSLVMPIDDQFISYVDPSSALPVRFEKHLKQGARRVDSTMTFDHKTLTAQADDKTVAIDPETRDVIALFYYIRTLDLSSGKQYKLAGILDGKPITVLVNPEQKAVIETANGPVEAIEVALRSEAGQGRRKKINDEYQLRAWLTNDEKRTPVFITARPPFGDIQVRLAKREM